MAWRVAKSLEVLLNEINTIAPNRSKLSDGSIGDDAHQAAGSSDHLPNVAGVVCARDFTHDPGNGADMHQLAEHIKRGNHIAVKYVIWNRRIWSKARNSEGWRVYSGSNPHTKHMHVSVGVGSDGRSTGPYDDASSWGLVTTTGGIMLPKYGDEGEEVRYWQRMLTEAGETFPKYGTDGKFGGEMTAAVKSWFTKQGGSGFDGKRITSWIAMRLQQQVFKGAKGDRGPSGPAGKDGVLTLPMDVQISGTITGQ